MKLRLAIKNEGGDTVLMLKKSTCCICDSNCCQDVDFPILTMDDNPQEVDIVMSVLMDDHFCRGWQNFQAMDWSHEGGVHRCWQLRGEFSRGFGCEGEIKAILGGIFCTQTHFRLRPHLWLLFSSLTSCTLRRMIEQKDIGGIQYIKLLDISTIYYTEWSRCTNNCKKFCKNIFTR